MTVNEWHACTQVDIDPGFTTSQTIDWYWTPGLTKYLNGTVEAQGNTIYWSHYLAEFMVFAGFDPLVVPPVPKPPTPPSGPVHPTSGQGWPLW
jgi:hypothetical protein